MPDSRKDTAIALFVKTPGLSPVKTRLAASIGAEAALGLYRLCLRCVDEAVDRVVTRLGAGGCGGRRRVARRHERPVVLVLRPKWRLHRNRPLRQRLRPSPNR